VPGVQLREVELAEPEVAIEGRGHVPLGGKIVVGREGEGHVLGEHGLGRGAEELLAIDAARALDRALDARVVVMAVDDDLATRDHPAALVPVVLQ